jgi:hypothetical protein
VAWGWLPRAKAILRTGLLLYLGGEPQALRYRPPRKAGIDTLSPLTIMMLYQHRCCCYPPPISSLTRATPHRKEHRVITAPTLTIPTRRKKRDDPRRKRLEPLPAEHKEKRSFAGLTPSPEPGPGIGHADYRLSATHGWGRGKMLSVEQLAINSIACDMQ